MEKDANYALVGLFSLLLLVGLMAFGIWLSQLSLNRDFQNYDIVFQGPVNGLSKGGEVRFNGIKVGEIAQIELYPQNTEKVVAHVRMSTDVPVRADSVATIEPLGITGVNFIQVSAGTRANALIREQTAFGKTPVIPSRPSALDGILSGGESVLTETVKALQGINAILTPQNIASIEGTLRNTEAFSVELARRKEVIADTQATLQSLDNAAQEIAALSASSKVLLEGDGAQTLRSLGEAATETQAAVRDVRAFIARVDGPEGEYTASGLAQFTAAIGALQGAADSLTRLSRELEANPRGLLTKSPGKEKEVRP
ncbi:MAG: MCE family protein [Phenylobacterium sp.]|uniref:MlaD family protein n=1 Tax=Phenylobacterium sp. TaxID=1871053 RepID=UPI0025CCCB65|nr:MlaD family protein [Phenylobacterium sp.]MCA6243433.1 MCE family protein [Phenylobacterium sp.]MCA6245274.1 MCE family protein [Phenylobacterium sp.]MCA6272699.1 MCE family protein [Phenylobacterium sp.]